MKMSATNGRTNGDPPKFFRPFDWLQSGAKPRQRHTHVCAASAGESLRVAIWPFLKLFARHEMIW